MQNIQLINLKEEQQQHLIAPKLDPYQIKDNLFQLRPLFEHGQLLKQQKKYIYLQHNFTPVYCPKTQKVIRTLPSIIQDKCGDALFRNDVDYQMNLKYTTLGLSGVKGSPSNLNASGSVQNSYFKSKSMKSFQETSQQKQIFIPKPSSRYCQICKENFTDYLQHINHSFHKGNNQIGKKMDKDIQELNRILKKSSPIRLNQKRKPTIKIQRENNMLMKSKKSIKIIDNIQQESCSQKYIRDRNASIEKDQCEVSSNIGSKKRIVVNQEGEQKILTYSSRTLESPTKFEGLNQTIKDLKDPDNIFQNIFLDQSNNMAAFGQKQSFMNMNDFFG